jgi:hypothetical protein
MAEDATSSHPSRYVKLTKDQDAPAEDILPGELNQPVHVPQLEGRRCSECGQVLPESYEPPADEPWTTGIFGCTDDPETCNLLVSLCLSHLLHCVLSSSSQGVHHIGLICQIPVPAPLHSYHHVLSVVSILGGIR